MTAGLVSVLAIAAIVAAPASAATPKSPGGVIRLVRHSATRNVNQSGNWFGYNIGALDVKKTFHSVIGVWTVPTATQHQSGQSEDSADWVGIGGGCVNSTCTVTDDTLIQTGTEQDVSSGGSSSYNAWWELIPAPEIPISGMTIKPGDEMAAEISETVANSDVWNIHIIDVTEKESFTKQVPYTSSHDTVEWIEETPEVNGAIAPLPNLTTVEFSHAMYNGANANLNPAEEIELVNSSNQVIATPSAPGPDLESFNQCAWATSCPAPAS